MKGETVNNKFNRRKSDDGKKAKHQFEKEQKIFSIGCCYLYLHKILSKQKRREKKIIRNIYIYRRTRTLVYCIHNPIQYCVLIESENQVEDWGEDGNAWASEVTLGLVFRNHFLFSFVVFYTTSTAFSWCCQRNEKRRRGKGGGWGRKRMRIHEQTRASATIRTNEQTNKYAGYVFVCIGKCLCAHVNPKRIWSVAFANDYLLENINSIFKWILTMCLRIHITFYLLLCFIRSLRNYCRSKRLWK